MAQPAPAGHGPFNRQQPWARWWIWLWGVVAVGLIVSVFFRAPFMAWTVAAIIGFGTMETIGLRNGAGPYPPLTQVIREYIPRWLAFTLIYGSTGMAAGTWFRFKHRLGLAVVSGLLGWFTAHFDTTFDNPAVVQERTKYAYYARRLGLQRASERLMARQAEESASA